ncbi:YopX family protein [Paenibacillus sp. GCM10023248]|uniref:YopX family protein n=1 Tax=unclassified Paenibacillus TaxID=185978 RepID=UPI002378EC15|nr:YopX family protein [Paenibacillus sp. MAHUQ-63]MDD9265988.1 YopX family protein [Paenibacillus sp. MAHUQ-63]
MREIKFRAWDKVQKVMIEHDDDNEFYICNEYGNITFPIKTPDNYSIPFGEGEDRFELMQFTGLLDSDGVEIYEGDLHELDGEVGVVEYHDGTYFVIGEWVTRFLYLQYSEEKGKVIGNIHEHPEFLES